SSWIAPGSGVFSESTGRMQGRGYGKKGENARVETLARRYRVKAKRLKTFNALTGFRGML
ncbi:MAG: hypothetical protein LIQ31_03355, partial [Planctomycetes bacterium]|nr:hypothetical protein [Planctomycetota bacterium]